ncbi:MAG: hypothetical protein JJD96_09785, partial [Thermoleophilia bacterium]|nr:hypothetical protein [Thermoleophilia bacterium]
MDFGKLRKPVSSFAAVIAISLALVIFLAASGAAAPPSGDEEFGVIASAEDANVNADSGVMFMTSAELKGLLDDNGDGNIDAADNPTNDPVVVDITDPTRYAVGHIPGSILVTRLSDPAGAGYIDMAKPANLEKIRTELARHCNKTIVLVCYTGTSDKWSRAVLGAMAQTGYFGPGVRVTSLKWGNMGWNTAASTMTPPSYNNTYDMETTPNLFSTSNPYPVVDNTTSTEPSEIIRAAGDPALQPAMIANIAAGTGAGQINPSNISSWTIIDIRSTTEYAAGHIPGAINMLFQDLFKTTGGDYSNLLSIDRSKQILLYGNTEKEAAVASVSLNMLGIRSASAPTGIVKFGLASWNKNYGEQFLGPATEPVVTGSLPGVPTDNPVIGAIKIKWDSLSGAPGPALGAEYAVMNGSTWLGQAQDFSNGRIFWNPSGGCWWIHGGILVKYNELGGATGFLGIPVSDEYDIADGRGANFAGGRIYWSL